MTGNETVTFQNDGKDYEIRITSDGFTTRIRVFLDGKPANGYTYSVDSVTAFDLRRVLGVKAIDDLIETAKNDIINKNWERFLEAIEKTNK